MASSYAVNRRNVAEGLLVAIKDFSLEMAILWDLKVMLKEHSIKQTNYFTEISMEDISVVLK